MPKRNKHKPFYRRKFFLWPVSLLLILVIGLVLAFRLSPWPGALVIRFVFDRGGHQTLVKMEQALPHYPVTEIADQQYRPGDKDAKLDVYMPKASTQQNLPVVVWIHGGAWLSGNKIDSGPYFERLASQGFVVIAPNYSLAPAKRYPTAVHQLNDALAFVQEHAPQYHIDATKIVLAGDSAGAQLASQLAAVTTNAGYAREVGVQPALNAFQLAGAVLYCGIYKMEGLTQPDPQLPKIVGWGQDVTVWAYTGTRDKSSPLIRQMSAYYHVTKDFPATFISGGNGDPLTNVQSMPLAQKLSTLGVPVTRLFYASGHTPSLPHEYQFTFNHDGENAFTQTVKFLKATTGAH